MRVLVVRLGAFGDAVQITPLLRELKKAGNHVTLYGSQKSLDVIRNNPNVDKFILHDKNIKPSDLSEHLAKVAQNYDKMINLSGAIEERLLKKEGTEAFNWDHIQRHIACDINYAEAILRDGGFDGADPQTELYFSAVENHNARNWRKKYKDYFVILWSLSGSSFHKTWPYSEYVGMSLYEKYKDILIVTVGDESCQLLEWRNDRTKNYSGIWPIRKSFIMTQYVDCVIGPETGVLNAASAFDTPKIVFLSHSSVENLTKHWKNTISLSAKVDCQPCHRLIYTREACPLEPGLWTPVCMSQIHMSTVIREIEKLYFKWREKRWVQYTQGTGRSTRKMEGCMTA